MTLLLVLVFSPFVEEKRWPFSAWFPASPTAEEIAAAIIPKLQQPKLPTMTLPTADQIGNAVVEKLQPIIAAKTSQVTRPQNEPPPFVNPLHSPEVKWKVAASMRDSIKAGTLNPGCLIIIVRYQGPYAEDYASDLKDILDVVGLKYVEHFADRTLEKELMLREVESPDPSEACGKALSLSLSSYIVTRHGTSGSGMVGPVGITEGEAPDYLRHCLNGCVEADFGNEDPLR